MGSNKSLAKLTLGASASMLALCFAFSASAQTAPASEDVVDSDEIVVTGSSIRGVAPVGSNLVSVGTEALEDMAANTATELVNTVPAITTAGSTPQAQSSYSYYAPSIHQLAGSGSNSTLTLIDGLRTPGGGVQYAQSDPNIIPTTALQRVEVLADGASSVYGSDAVAGVVNFITRKTYDGAQLNGRWGFADGYESQDFTAIWGNTWDDGGFYIAGQFLRQDELMNDIRPFLSMGDYRPVGGTNRNTFNCSPATIRTAASGTNVYTSPTATSTVPGTADNAVCNNLIYGSAIPGVERQGLMAVYTQDINERLNFTGKIVYNYLQHFTTAAPGMLNNVAAYGPGSGRGGQINPFYTAPAGEPGAVQQTVSWLALNPEGYFGSNDYANHTTYLTGVLEYELTEQWTATFSGALARSTSTIRGENVFCSACAVLAINGTPNTNGSLTGSAVPGESVVVTRVPLTTTNALDVWNPTGTNGTSQAVWNYIYSGRTLNEHQNNNWQLKLDVQGPVFSLPAGALRLAVGAELMNITQDIYAVTPQGTGSGYRNFTMNLGPRDVTSAYLELFIPVIGEDMNIPMVQSFDVSLSGRFDDYSDWGSTTNPKIAATWRINDWLSIRGNWAESFVAPPLNQIGDPNQGYLRGATGTNVSTQIDVPFALYPEVRDVPGCETVTGPVCRIGGTLNPGLDRSLGAGFAGVEPQIGGSWSVGADVALGGFRANVTYWTNTYDGGVNSPAQPLIINSAGLHDRLTICPTGCTPDQVRVFTNVDNGATVGGTLPSTVYFMINRDVGNVLYLDVAGWDAMFDWTLSAGAIGDFILGASLTYFTKFDQAVSANDPYFSILNTSGYNSQFPSVQTKARFSFGYENGPFAATLFANYTGEYNNWINTSVIPITSDASGNPTGGGDPVDSDLIFDFNARWEFQGALEGNEIYLDVKNLLDDEPPFYNGNTTGAGGVGGWGFNGFTSNALGRIVSVGFRARF